MIAYRLLISFTLILFSWQYTFAAEEKASKAEASSKKEKPAAMVPAKPSKKGKAEASKNIDLDKLSLEGHLRTAFRIARTRARSRDNQFGFELSEIKFRAKYRIKKKQTIHVKYEITPSDQELQEAFYQVKRKRGWFNRVRFGLQPRFYKIESDLITDSLGKMALSQTRDVGVLGSIHMGTSWKFHIALFNGSRLKYKNISPREVESQDIILVDGFDKRQAIGTSSRELTLGLGYDHKAKSALKSFKSLVFLGYAPLSDADKEDLDVIADIPGFTGVNEGNTGYGRLGWNLSLRYKQWRFRNQIAQAQIRELVRTFFHSELSYQMKKWRPVLAYSQQDLNISPETDSPASWGRQRFTMALRYKQAKKSRFAMEITVNTEDTGGRFINNDEARFIWTYGF